MGKSRTKHQVKVAATKAWELYGTIKLANLMGQQPYNVIDKVQILQGDAGVGTVLKVTLPPGLARLDSLAFSRSSQRLTMRIVRQKKELIEGGYLQMGYIMYRSRIDILNNGEHSCNLRSTIEHDIKDGAVASAPSTNIQHLADVAEFVKSYLAMHESNSVC